MLQHLLGDEYLQELMMQDTVKISPDIIAKTFIFRS